jgi:hypothetical protein
MDKFEQDITWLAQQMGIPPEIALRIAKEGGMNVPPQPGGAPMNFTIEDDRNLPIADGGGPNDPMSLMPPEAKLKTDLLNGPMSLMSVIKGMYSGQANPMQSTGKTLMDKVDPDFMNLFSKLKAMIGG